MAYTTLADVKTFLGVGDTSDDTLIAALIAAAQQAVDGYCRRTFEASSDTTRAFDACSPAAEGRVLLLDADLCAITQITNGDGAVLASSAYVAEPQGGPPYHAIRLLASSGTVWLPADGEAVRAIAIEGRWAYATSAPPAVVQATKEVVAWLYRGAERQPANAGARSVPPAMPPAAALLLEPYRRI